MDGILQALILGVVQGLTEFLPVSSSGHLVLAQQWMGDAFVFLKNAVVFDLVLHVGTLLPVLWFYRRNIIAMVKSFGQGSPREEGPLNWLKSNDDRWISFVCVLASVPTGVIGLTLKDSFESLFHNIPAVAAALCLTGVILFLTHFFGAKEGGSLRISIWQALIIGLAQGFAITPGISRSGSTIATALLLGIERETAARFSFLLSIPAILGALVIVAKDGVALSGDMGAAIAVGFVSAMIVGYLALVMLVALVKRGGIHNFAYYLWVVAALAVFFLR